MENDGMKWMPTVLLAASLLGWGCNDGDPSEVNNIGPDTFVSGADTTSPPPDVAIGTPCVSNPEFCESPGICSTLLPGGYCTTACDQGQACPVGSECREINNFPFCMRTCATSSDCRTSEGYSCNDGVCDKGCESNDECAPGTLCLEASCIPGCETSASCPTGEVCQSNQCVVPSGDVALGQPCEINAQCTSDICLKPEDGGICAEACTTSGCSVPNWSCRGLVPVGGAQPLNLCAPPTAFIVQEQRPTLLQTQGFPTYEIMVPEDTVSFLIVVEAEDPSSYLTVVNIVAPDGRLYADEGRTGFTRPFRTSPNEGTAAVLIPQNSDANLQMQSGRWRFSVAAFNFGLQIKSIKVLLKRSASGFAGNGEVGSATFDLNVFIAAGARSGLTASNAANDNHVQNALARMRDKYWAPHNIEMGNVRYFPLDTRYLVIDSEGELKDMFRLASPPGESGSLNLFLIRDFALSSDPRSNPAGIAGGIPGTPGINGTPASGVAVALQRNANASGDNMTHELGHYLGLFHISEFQNQGDDVVLDTQSCANGPEYAMQSYQTTFQIDPCMNNIMFPSLLTDLEGFDSRFDQLFTGEQGRVIRFQPHGR